MDKHQNKPVSFLRPHVVDERFKYRAMHYEYIPNKCDRELYILPNTTAKVAQSAEHWTARANPNGPVAGRREVPGSNPGADNRRGEVPCPRTWGTPVKSRVFECLVSQYGWPLIAKGDTIINNNFTLLTFTTGHSHLWRTKRQMLWLVQSSIRI